MKHSSLIRLAAATALLAGAALGARAADAPAAEGALAQACKGDVEALCAGVKPGEGRIAACLRQNRSKLSDGCKAAIKDARKHKGGKAAD